MKEIFSRCVSRENHIRALFPDNFGFDFPVPLQELDEILAKLNTLVPVPVPYTADLGPLMEGSGGANDRDYLRTIYKQAEALSALAEAVETASKIRATVIFEPPVAKEIIQ